LVIKLSEKESLLKSFSIFFITIELLIGILFFNYYKQDVERLRDKLLLEMKNYSFNFKDKKFNIDLIDIDPLRDYYTLHENNNSLYIVAPLAKQKSDLKIIYPKTEYIKSVNSIKRDIFKKYLLITILVAIISFIFSLFILKPIRESSKMMQTFIKDIIHDLNTPITSILLNLRLINENSEEIEDIKKSAYIISMLHQNLNNYLKNIQNEPELFDTKEILDKNIEFFSSIYQNLEWDINIKSLYIKTDKSAFYRAIHNLISNACKYNTQKGFIKIDLDNNILTISNSSYGIKNPKRVFERFYKESDRGLGIGLHIVRTNLKNLNIDIDFKVDKNNIVTVKLNLKTIITKKAKSPK